VDEDCFEGIGLRSYVGMGFCASPRLGFLMLLSTSNKRENS
jgi:hypothetical protein